MKNLSLRTKIIISFTSLIFLFAFVAVLYGNDTLSKILESELNEKGISLGKSLATDSEPLLVVDDAFSIHELFSNIFKSDADIRYIFIEAPQDIIRYHTFEKGIPLGLRQINNIGTSFKQNLRVIYTNEGRILDIATPIARDKESVLRLGLSYARHESMLKQYVYFIIVLAGIVTIFALLISNRLARLLTSPIGALTRVTNAVAQGDLSLKAPQGGDEIGRLGTNFNIMTEKLSSSRDELLQTNKELTVLNENRAHLLKQVINAQEEERKRIARELHDDVGQVLSRIAVVSADIEEKGPEFTTLSKRISGIKEDATYALRSLRETILNLRPMILDDLGLIPAIRWYARERLEKSGVRFHLEAEGLKERLDPQIEIVLFRVMQEAINNIGKYAHPKEASISLVLNDGFIRTEIRDDGIGFDMEEQISNSENTAGFGISGMRERLNLIGGTLKISSKQGHGTAICLEIPYMKG